MTDRISLLKQKTRDAYSKELHDFRIPIAERIVAEFPSEPQNVKLAMVLEEFQSTKPIITFDEDLFAGYAQVCNFAYPGIDRFSGSCPPRWRANDRPWENGWPDNTHNAIMTGLFSSCPGAHHIVGYIPVLQRGIGAFIEDTKARLATATGQARDFARAALITLESHKAYTLRYAARFDALASEASDGDRARLQRIADACRWVATEPPRDFFEALQLLWMTHETVHCEQGLGSLSLGRLDQYLYPYYKADLETGKLTKDDAQELIEALWVKFSGLPQAFQHVTLGGQDQHGASAVNDLTYMALRASRKLMTDQPLIGMRYTPDMPDELWELSTDLIARGTGFPAFFNDEPCIEAKVRQGIPREEAVEYGIVGCVEMSMPGREYAHTEAFRINFVKVLELMLNRGVCPVTNYPIEMLENRDPDSVETFDEFYDWYKRELVRMADVAAESMNIIDTEFPKYKPTTFASVTCDGCLEKGKDVSDGGTIYNFSTINVTGQANAADALVAIKRLIYDEKRMTFAELAAILRQNFAGYEGLRKEILGFPKYGNDKEEPDTIYADIVHTFADRVATHTNPRGGMFQVGLFTAGWHGVLGSRTGASPDGRLEKTALCSGSSPVQGTDSEGPTAVLQSAAKVDHAIAGNGVVVDLKFHPSFFDADSRRQAFRHLIETYFKLGGMELQINCVTKEQLEEAQAHPEQHRDLLVRVSGYSAYFVNLDRLIQDEIIKRTELASL